MSQSAAVRTARTPRPVPRHQGHQLRPVPVPQPPRLRVVSAARHTRSRAGLVVASVVLLVLGLVGLLLLDVSLERGTYDLRDQNQRAEQLRDLAQKYRREIVQQEAPQNLEDNAHKLGMVPGSSVFVLPSGRKVGVPRPAVKPPSPTVTSPTAKPSTPASGKATATAKAATSPSH
jgi:hypothetical protein